MTELRQGWLVALREMRERSRSRIFLVSMGAMILVVLSVIVVPALLDSGAGAKDVGLTGAVPRTLAQVIEEQGGAVGATVRVHDYGSVAAGEQAVRDGDIDVLVVDGHRLEWRRQADQQLQAIVTGSVQLIAVRERATAAGITPAELLTLLATVRIQNVELGSVSGRSPDDESAALIMTVMLFVAITTYASLVLSGVVEEKASRVVEVLLARMPARTLLAGKVAGIGVLGLGQFALTALVALAALTAVDSADLPAVSGGVLAWAVVWFLLGYALYAMVYGALGSLASRAEDAQNVTGPVAVVLIAGFFTSFAAVGRPDSVLAIFVSYFPPTAPMAMPDRIAMGATEWWEPVLAAALTLALIAGLVQFSARVYAGAVLHVGPTVRLRDAWRGVSGAGSGPIR